MRNKRTLSALIGVLLTLLVSCTSPETEDEPPPTTEHGRPNVLIFITDDQRTDSMEAMPLTSKWFMEEGRWYPNAFATTPVCCPSRASIFSGRFAHNHEVKKFTPYKLNQRSTLQAHLQRDGYRTGFYGKYLNGYRLSSDPPYLDDWAVFPQSMGATYSGGTWNVNGTVRQIHRYSTEFMRGKAFDFIEGGSDEPWLMYLTVPAAHLPYRAEAEFEDAPVKPWEGNEGVFEEDISDKPPHVRTPVKGSCDFECGEEIRAKQHRTLMSADRLVDEVMTKLEELGQADNTLAFFLSDNGVMWGEHGLANKRVPYEQSVKIPFGLRWPVEVEPGTDERLVATIDIAPTVLEAAGIEQRRNKRMDGRSLLANDWERDEMLIEHWSAKTVPAYASLWGLDYQYVEYYTPDLRRITFREFYDLEKDPWQLDNLLATGADGARPDVATIQQLHQRLSELRDCKGKSCP